MTVLNPAAPIPDADRIRQARRLHPALVPLTVILIFAAGLRLYNLSVVGDGNTYYTAAVTAMLQSPTNFFFAAAEPGGSVTVDKPPVGLWFQVLSASIFGVSGVSVVLPEVIAGILSVLVLYVIIKRTYGVGAGLIAAAVLAISPINVAVDRNNTMDSIMILFLLLAAWAFMNAIRSRKIGWLLAGMVLVGIGFNVKMLQAFLPLPAFYAAYLLGAKVNWIKRISFLGAATAVLCVVSFSWATIVAITPAEQRPYIGGSENNSAFDLIFGYNGLERLSGPDGAGAPPSGTMPLNNGNVPIPANGGQFSAPIGMGASETGEPGFTRLFTGALSNEIAWLLPFALCSAVFGAGAILWGWRKTPRTPISEQAAGVVLWGGWLITCMVFFSVAQFFHAYYMGTVAPAVAALVGIGVYQLWKLSQTRWSLALLALIGVIALTIVQQVVIADSFGRIMWWLPAALALIAFGVALIIYNYRRGDTSFKLVGYVSAMTAVLIAPLTWSVLTATNPNPNIVLPQAFDQALSEDEPNLMLGGMAGAPDLSEQAQAMVDYLQANTQDTTYMVAVPSAMFGADMVIETKRAVLYLGGFSGQDPVLSVDQFSKLVDDGKLRYVWDVGMLNMGQPEIAAWVQANCVVDENVDLGFAMPELPNGQGFQLPNNMQLPPNAQGMQPPNGIPNAMLLMGGEMIAPQARLYDCRTGS